MSDIDDELLALAGGDVSSEEEGPTSVNISRNESRSPRPPEPTPTTKKEAAPPTKTAAVKKTPAKTPKKRARADDESEEEGEASSAPSTPASQQSASMDESSDSDASPNKSRGDDGTKYPVEGLFISLAEKAEIMGMREVERELILAERREEYERLRQNRMLRQLVINQDNEDSKRKKRKAGAAEIEEGPRKTSRVRTKVGGTKVGETSPRFESLRKAREDRSNRAQQRELERDRRKDRSPSFRPGADDDGEIQSEIEWAPSGKTKGKSRTPEIREIPPADLRDIERTRLGRSRFANVCFYPGFDEAITGCFTRISIGPDPNSGQNVYRMGLIKGFTQGKPYAISNLRGMQFVTDQYVKAAHGKAVREWPFISCSDSDFTEAEWERYKKTCLAEGVPLPNKQVLQDKAAGINALVNRSWTEDEIRKKLDRQNTLKIKYSGAKRERLAKDLERAFEEGNEAKAAKLQEELDTMETPRLAFKTTLGTNKKDQSATPTQQDRLAEVNAENRRRNQEAVRRAQLKERARAREIEARIERGEHVEEDHSKRLKTRAKFVHDVNENLEPRKRNTTPGGTTANNSGASTPATGTPRLGATLPLLPHLAKLQQARMAERKGGIPVIHKPITDDDIIGALDLDIDVQID